MYNKIWNKMSHFYFHTHEARRNPLFSKILINSSFPFHGFLYRVNLSRSRSFHRFSFRSWSHRIAEIRVPTCPSLDSQWSRSPRQKSYIKLREFRNNVFPNIKHIWKQDFPFELNEKICMGNPEIWKMFEISDPIIYLSPNPKNFHQLSSKPSFQF